LKKKHILFRTSPMNVSGLDGQNTFKNIWLIELAFVPL